MSARRAVRIGTALATVAVAAGLAATALASPPSRHQAAALSSLEQGVLADINSFRAEHGLVPLQISEELTRAARQHSQEMAVDGYFAHDSADGGAFWKRIQRFYPSGSFGLWSVGENLLWSSPDVSAAKALQMWEASPEHRANLLTARWREIGISAVHEAAAPGTYHGLSVTIVTTDFGVRQ